MPRILPKRQIAHLHSHTEYSLLDGIKNSAEFLKAAKAKGIDAYAITEHGNMASAMGFNLEAIKPEMGIKPIFGIETYVVDDASKKDREQKSSHLVLLARDNEGFENLLRLSNFSWNEGFYYKAKVDYAALKKYSKGITALTACMGGVVSSAIRYGGEAAALARVKQLKAIFGEYLYLEVQLHEEVYGPDLDRVYRKIASIKSEDESKLKRQLLEDSEGKYRKLLQEHVTSKAIVPEYETEMRALLGDSWMDQATVNKYMLRLAKKTKTKFVLTGDCHYPLKGDHRLQDLIIRVGFGNYKKARQGEDASGKSQSSGRGYYSSQLYVKSNSDFDRSRSRWHKYMTRKTMVKAIRATHEIADSVTTSIPIGQHQLPTYQVKDDPMYARGDDRDSLFEKMIEEGFSRLVVPRVDKKDLKSYRERLRFEISTIKQAHFVDYFLIIKDIVRWARSNGIHCVARGSVAGSLVAYALDITGIDPIPYKLLFERFLNPTRVSGERAKAADALPDIDLDFERFGRGRVKKYIVEKYGKDRVLTIGSYGTMGVKTLIKDFARVLDYRIGDNVYDYKKINDITGSVDNSVKDLDEALETSEPFAKFYEENKGWFETYIRPLQGEIRSMSKHAAGVLITPTEFTKWVPVRTQMLEDEDDEEGKIVISQWEDVYCERRGLLKLDILGVKQLDVFHRCLDLIKKRHGIDVALDEIDIADRNVYKKFHAGDNFGVFQFNSTLQSAYMRKMKPNTIGDLCASNALLRPGPMQEAAHEDFVKLKSGKIKPDYAHDCVVPYLSETFGLMIYQEQTMQVANVLGGLTLAEADMMRSAIKKKDEKLMNPFLQKFVEGCLKKGLVEKHARAEWDKIVAFSKYGFNKCVSGDTLVHRAGANQYQPDPRISIKKLYDAQNSQTDWGQKIRSGKLQILQMGDNGRIVPGFMKAVHFNGRKRVYLIKTDSGREIKATLNHRFMTDVGYRRVHQLIKNGGNLVVMSDVDPQKESKGGHHTRRARGKSYGQMGFPHLGDNPAWIDGRHVTLQRSIKKVLKRSKSRCEHCGKKKSDGDSYEFAHIKTLEQCGGDYSKRHAHNNILYLCNSCHKKYDYTKGERKKRWAKGRRTHLEKIVTIEDGGFEDTFDIEMAGHEHNFVANDIVSHNSHAATYALQGYYCQWLKTYFTEEFYTATMEFASDDSKKNENIYTHRRHAMEEGIRFRDPSINHATVSFDLTKEGRVYWPTKAIKGVGEKASAIIAKHQPFSSMEDFMSRIEKRIVNKRVVVKLIFAGAFKQFGPTRKILRAYFKLKGEKFPEEFENFDRVSLKKLRDTTLGYISMSYKKILADNFGKSVVRSYEQFEKMPNRSRVSVGGVVTAFREIKTRNGGKRMAFVVIEDKDERYDIVVFPSFFATIKTDDMPTVGRVVQMTGTKGVSDRGDTQIVLGNPGVDKSYVIY